jgi:methyl coenzyme M reductase beta subunit
MNKTKLVLDIVENLRNIASSIENLVNGIDNKETEGASTISEVKEEVITLEQVRAILAEKSQSGKQQQVKALIQKHGANKLTDIDPSCYKNLLKEAEVL